MWLWALERRLGGHGSGLWSGGLVVVALGSGVEARWLWLLALEQRLSGHGSGLSSRGSRLWSRGLVVMALGSVVVAPGL